MFWLMLTASIVTLSAYFLWRFFTAFPGLGWWRLLAVAVLLLLATGRIWGRALQRTGWDGVGHATELITLLWMVMLFWFLSAGLVLNLWNVLAWGVNRVWPALVSLRLSPREGFLATTALVLLASAWGFVEAYRVGVRHVVVEVDYLPQGRQSLRIAQITDVHVGETLSRQRLDAAVRLLHHLQPDIIVSTGDLVDSHLQHINHLAEGLGEVPAPLGKYAVLGNHEFYIGLQDSMAFHEAAGFRVLRQEAAIPIEGLRIVGVDDPAARRRGQGAYIDEMPVLPERSGQEVVILLKHQPLVNPQAVGRFDLQLSGHTHGGQVLPFRFLTRLAYDYTLGRYDLGQGSVLYVSPGTGTWGPPLRLGAPPEVTLIELRARPQAAPDARP